MTVKEIFTKLNEEGYFIVAICYYESDANKLSMFNLKRSVKEFDGLFYVLEDRNWSILGETVYGRFTPYIFHLL
jgi:hypothetical protein